MVNTRPKQVVQPALQHGAQRGAKSTSTGRIRKTAAQTKVNKKVSNRKISKEISQDLSSVSAICTNEEGDVSDTLYRLASRNSVAKPSTIEALSSPSMGSSTLIGDLSVSDQIAALERANRELQIKFDALLGTQGGSTRFSDPPDREKEPGILEVSPGLSRPYALDRQLDRMLRYMPEFNGKAEENFESYVLGAKAALVYGVDCTVGQKLDAIKVRIGGDAREVLANCGKIETISELFSALHDTYGKDERSLIADVKQKPNEPVRVFATRLRSNLKILGWGCHDANKPNLVSLDYFLNGLLPSLSTDVRKMLPRDLDVAVDYAIQVEGMKSALNFDSNKSIKKLNSVGNANTDNTPVAANNQAQASVNRSVSDKLAALSAQLKDAFNKNSSQDINRTQTQNTPSRGGQHDYRSSVRPNNNRPDNGDYKNRTHAAPYNNRSKRSFYGRCFGCKEQGHLYMDCKKITGEKMDEIRENYDVYVAEHRAAMQALNSQGVSAPSQ